MKNSWPTTVEELVDECERLKSRYDLYTLGEKGEPFQGESEPRVDGTRYLAGEYQYGVAMIPAQWVTHVLSEHTEPDAATVGDGEGGRDEWRSVALGLFGSLESADLETAKQWIVGNELLREELAYGEAKAATVGGKPKDNPQNYKPNGATVSADTCEMDETETIECVGDGIGHYGKSYTIHVMECSKCGRTYEHVNGDYPRCPYCGRFVEGRSE